VRASLQHLPMTARRTLLAILLTALLLRLWTIGFPDWYNVDEQLIVDLALLLPRTGLNPEWFINPSLFLYLLFGLDALFYGALRICAIVGSPEEFAALYFAHPLLFHVLGRALSLAAGIGALVMTFRLGRDAWGMPVGLAAAGLLAVAPVAVEMSRIAKVDMVATLLLLVATGAILGYLRERRVARLWAAAATTGLAISTKYTAGIAVLWLVAAPLIVERGRRGITRAAVTVLLAAATFLVGTPFTLLDVPTFGSDVGWLSFLM